MNLFKKLDLWSIMDELDKMTEYDYTCTKQKSIYWDYYSDQLRELCFLAADMYNELDQLKSKIYQKMPYKKIEFCSEDECFQTAIAWFNTAACMLSDTDMTVLLENENIYESDIAFEKQKRINALSRLTKEQQLFLYTEVTGFITRYLELAAAFDTITAVINELEYHQSFAAKNNKTILPQESYL